MTDLIGKELGNYRLVRLLGKGGFGEVYLGQHLRLNIQAAIKVHLKLAGEDIKNFHQEARIIASLTHPHIVRILDYDVKENTPFIVMDYAPNGSLRQRHPKGEKLPLLTVVSYVTQVAEALQYAHDQKLVHRDVKPDNMLLGLRGEVLLSDFGIATVAHNTSSLSTLIMAGTVPYMAPEQAQGKPRPASDQYALGVVVYEWLAGSRPFTGTATEVMMQHLSASVPPLREKVPTILPEVERVVMKALAKDPKERFGNIEAFATALEQACLPAQDSPSVLQSRPLLSPSVTPPSSQHVWPAITAPSSSQPSEQSILTPLTTGPQSSKHHIPRRTIVLSLVGLATAASGLTWLALSHFSLGPAPESASTTPPSSTLTAPASCSSGFSDDFTQSSYDKRWQWIPGGNATVMIAQGSLSISASVDQDLYIGNTSAPKLLQSIQGNFTVETLVDFTPGHTYQGAGILLWQDSKNFIRLEHGYGDFSAIIFEQEVNGDHQKMVGPFSKDPTKIPTAARQVKLRIQRNNTTVATWWQELSRDTGWQAVGSTQASFGTSILVGLAVVNKPQPPNPDNTGAPITAQFDYFRVTCDGV